MNPEQITSSNTTQIATLGNGCFWCTEAIFQSLKGVVSVQSGYSGGHMDNPDYKTVCSGVTGHAECLQIHFNTTIISYTDLLNVFWNTHDPTQLNRQGNDIGTQYRSVIFFHDTEQEKLAKAYLNQLTHSGVYEQPIVTQIVPFERFYPAEDYHTDYYNQHPENQYCQLVVRKKVTAFQVAFDKLLK
jgi:peptide-methionine (S)-S-oxide reductase